MKRLLVALALVLAGCRRPEEATVIAKGAEVGLAFDADATDAFWIEGRARLQAVPLEGGAARTLATGALDYVVASGSHVYFVDGAKTIARVPRAGGAVEKVASEAETIIAIAVDGDEVFYLLGEKVRAVRVGASPRDVATSARGPRSIVVTPTDVVWRTAPMFLSSDTEHGAVYAVARAGGAPRKLHATEVPESDLVAFGGEIWFRDGGVVFRGTMPAGTLDVVTRNDPGTLVGADATGAWLSKRPARFGGDKGDIHHLSRTGAVSHRVDGASYAFARTTPKGAFAYDGTSVVRIASPR